MNICWISAASVRYLPPDRFAALRERYFALRTRLHPVMRAIYGTFDSAALKAHLEQRVGRDFEMGLECGGIEGAINRTHHRMQPGPQRKIPLAQGSEPVGREIAYRGG